MKFIISAAGDNKIACGMLSADFKRVEANLYQFTSEILEL